MRIETQLLLVLTLWFLGGCASSSQASNELVVVKADLAMVRAERDMLMAKVENMWANFERERSQWLDSNYALKSELANLKDIEREKMLLQSSHDGLKNRHQRLDRWAKVLTDGYGPGIWVYSDEHFRPLYNRAPREATVSGILSELNESNRKTGNPILEMRRLEKGVVYLGVSDDFQPTMHMGSSGALAYIQSTLYSVASLDDVECVQFEFSVGDLATPGKYCK